MRRFAYIPITRFLLRSNILRFWLCRTTGGKSAILCWHKRCGTTEVQVWVTASFGRHSAFVQPAIFRHTATTRLAHPHCLCLPHAAACARGNSRRAGCWNDCHRRHLSIPHTRARCYSSDFNPITPGAFGGFAHIRAVAAKYLLPHTFLTDAQHTTAVAFLPVYLTSTLLSYRCRHGALCSD